MLTLKLRFYFVAIVGFHLLIIESAYTQSITKDLNLEWKQYAGDSINYEIYLNGSKHKPVYLLLDFELYETQFFNIRFSGEGNVFVNDKLIYFNFDKEKNNDLIWDIDSLRGRLPKGKAKITILGANNTLGTYIIPARNEYINTAASDLFTPQNRDQSILNNELIILLFILGILLVVLKISQGKGFYNYFDLSNIFMLKSRSNVFYETSVLESQSLTFYAIYAVLITFIGNLVFRYFYIIEFVKNTGPLFLVAAFLISYLSFLMKYLWVTIFSSLFGYKAVRKIQYHDHLRIGWVFSLFFAVVVLVGLKYLPSLTDYKLIIFLFFGFLLIRVLVIYMKLLALTSAK